MRLTRPEVSKLVHEGLIEEITPFPGQSFRYAVERSDKVQYLQVTYQDHCIRMVVPEALIRDWDTNDTISIDASMPGESASSIYLLLEKDFQCLDASHGDQNDNYVNPNKTC